MLKLGVEVARQACWHGLGFIFQLMLPLHMLGIRGTDRGRARECNRCCFGGLCCNAQIGAPRAAGEAFCASSSKRTLLPLLILTFLLQPFRFSKGHPFLTQLQGGLGHLSMQFARIMLPIEILIIVS